MKKKMAAGTTHDNNVEIQLFSRAPRILDLCRFQFLGEVWVDLNRKQLLPAVRQRLFQRRPNRLLTDFDLGDLVFAKEVGEFAVGDDIRLIVGLPDLLENQNDNEGEEKISDIETPRSPVAPVIHDQFLTCGNVYFLPRIRETAIMSSVITHPRF